MPVVWTARDVQMSLLATLSSVFVLGSWLFGLVHKIKRFGRTELGFETACLSNWRIVDVAEVFPSTCLNILWIWVCALLLQGNLLNRSWVRHLISYLKLLREDLQQGIRLRNIRCVYGAISVLMNALLNSCHLNSNKSRINQTNSNVIHSEDLLRLHRTGRSTWQ